MLNVKSAELQFREKKNGPAPLIGRCLPDRDPFIHFAAERSTINIQMFFLYKSNIAFEKLMNCKFMQISSFESIKIR